MNEDFKTLMEMTPDEFEEFIITQLDTPNPVIEDINNCLNNLIKNFTTQIYNKLIEYFLLRYLYWRNDEDLGISGKYYYYFDCFRDYAGAYCSPDDIKSLIFKTINNFINANIVDVSEIKINQNVINLFFNNSIDMPLQNDRIRALRRRHYHRGTEIISSIVITPTKNGKINDIKFLSPLNLFSGSGIDPGYGKSFPYFSNICLNIKQKIGKEVDVSNTLIYQYVSMLMGLTLDKKVYLEFDYNEYENLVPFEHSLSNGINDYLGFCHYKIINERSYETKISLLMNNINSFCLEHNHDPYDVMMIVYIHELVHYIYFNGVSLFGKKFFPFEVINSHSIAYNVKFDSNKYGTAEFHEILAQLVTYKIVYKDKDLLKTFNNMLANQPKLYTLWDDYKNCTIENLHCIIMESNDTDNRDNSLFKRHITIA